MPFSYIVISLFLISHSIYDTIMTCIQRKWVILMVQLCMVSGLFAQNESLVSTEEAETLLEKITDKRPEIDWPHMNVQFATSANAEFVDGDFEEGVFKVNRIRWEIHGSFNKKFSYHFRQNLNEHANPGYALDNLAGSVELAMVGWQLNGRLLMTVGKQAVQFSGYECWVNAIKVRYYSDFNSFLSCYQAGVNLEYKLNPNQVFNFQLVNNRNGSTDEMFVYGLPEEEKESKIPLLGTINWAGHFMGHSLQLRYSLSYGQQAKGKNIFFFTCGNAWDRKPFLAYIDFMYSREGLDSKGLISRLTGDEEGRGRTLKYVDYFTTIANLDYRIGPHWNMYIKGVYELGNIYRSYDEIQAGNYRRTWNAQICAEYFPMKNSEFLLYLHLLYKKTHVSSRARVWGADDISAQRISVGLVYTLPVF